MEKNPYRYLFPFEKVPKGARILIYGAGILGQEYLKQALITGYCNVVAFVDRNHEKYADAAIPVLSPDQIPKLEYDFIVLAMRTENWIPEIKRILGEHGVDEGRIVYSLEREGVDLSLLQGGKAEASASRVFAYDEGSISFSVLLSGGIGDMVNHKRFVMELLRLVPDAGVDIYTIQDEAFPEWLYSDCSRVRNIMLDLGSRYSSGKEKYSLSISIYGSAFVTVDHFRPGDFGEEYEGFVERIQLLQRRTAEEGISLSIPAAVAFYRRIYQGVDCYSWFNYGDVFDIHDYRITIPYLEADRIEYERLGLADYVTVNVGNGASKDGKRIAKTWPVERFQATVDMFRQRYPGIRVVQIGAGDSNVLERVDLHLMGKGFGLVAHVLRGAMFHLDIEGGLVHWASQIGTKCIVLFGPTSTEYNAYPNNTNIRRGSCHGCYGLYVEVTRCARHMAEPECMYSITPKIVMAEVERYMDGLERDGAGGCI